LDLKKIVNISELISDKSKKIAIITHVNPDGDAIGSCLGLYKFLKCNSYNNVSVITPNDFPEFLKWMTVNDEVIIANKNNKIAEELITDADFLFCLDFNNPNRSDILEPLFYKSKAKKILIDHHPQPADVFDFVISDIKSSSTAEIVFKFIRDNKFRIFLNKDIASCLYAGIMTDTGSFSYGCNNPDTFAICSELIKTGINADNINRLVYNTFSENRTRLLGYCLNKKLTVLEDSNAAYISITKEELNRFKHRPGDTEGIVNYALSIRNINIAALFIEKSDHIKLSLRSTGNFNVNEFSRKHFNGGGHKNAAGGKYYDNMNNTIKFFESVVTEFYNLNPDIA